MAEEDDIKLGEPLIPDGYECVMVVRLPDGTKLATRAATYDPGEAMELIYQSAQAIRRELIDHLPHKEVAIPVVSVEDL